MIDESTYNELDRYFHSAMNAEERSAFESRLNANAEMREEFQWLGIMLGGMKQQGRSVMKQTIASVIAGVPSGAVTKYKPSVNARPAKPFGRGKSFLKKYWWVVASVAAVAIAVGVYLYATRHIVDEGHSEGSDAAPQEMMSAPVDTACNDSLIEEMKPAESDTAYSVHIIDGQAEILIKGEPSNALEKKVDSVKSPAWYIANGGGGQPTQGGRKEPMATRINPRSQPPYTYSMDANLTLNANYTSTAGFSFRGSGDTVYMTDNNGVEFMLLRNKGEQPLRPRSVSK